MHAIHPAQPVNALSQAEHGHQESCRGACIAHVKLQRRGWVASPWNVASFSLNGEGSVGWLERICLNRDFETKGLEAIDHHLGILTP